MICFIPPLPYQHSGFSQKQVYRYIWPIYVSFTIGRIVLNIFGNLSFLSNNLLNFQVAKIRSIITLIILDHSTNYLIKKTNILVQSTAYFHNLTNIQYIFHSHLLHIVVKLFFVLAHHEQIKTFQLLNYKTQLSHSSRGGTVVKQWNSNPKVLGTNLIVDSLVVKCQKFLSYIN